MPRELIGTKITKALVKIGVPTLVRSVGIKDCGCRARAAKLDKLHAKLITKRK